MDKRKPELLSPAGDLERLSMAVAYGADAVYLSGKSFGMRASTCCFENDDIVKAVEIAHKNKVKLYITCNTLPREAEMKQLPDYLSFLKQSGVDGLIIADIGVLAMAKKYAPGIPIRMSTQLGVVNSTTASMLYDMGASAVVLARELSLEEIREIRRNTPEGLVLEAFVHGSMCVSFSGRCLLSNYLTDRDANRGQCAQPCRWKYHLVEETRPGEYFEITEDKGTFILNSRDMCMIQHLQELSDAGIDSFKIEGRMKSSYYTAVITNAYRHVIDDLFNGVQPDELWYKETEKVSHREYSTGFYYGYPGQHYGSSSYFSEADVSAIVLSCNSDGYALLSQRNKFCTGDLLEVLTPGEKPVKFTVNDIFDENGLNIDSTPHAQMKFYMQLPVFAPELSIIRKCR